MGCQSIFVRFACDPWIFEWNNREEVGSIVVRGEGLSNESKA